MPQDLETVMAITRTMGVIAAVCVSTFPALYMFSPWYSSPVGRAVMIQSLSVALAIDISIVFQFIDAPDDLLTILIINVVVLGFICLASLYLTATLFYYNFYVNKEQDMPNEKPFLSNAMYNRLKWTAQIFLPALGTLYFALSGTLGLPAAEEVVGTIVAVDAFLGTLLGLSTRAYKNSEAQFDGVVNVRESETHLNYDLVLNDSAEELKNREQLTFKVNPIVEGPPPNVP